MSLLPDATSPDPEGRVDPVEERVVLLDAEAVRLALARMAREVVERAEGTEGLVLLGIRRRGVELAERLRDFIQEGEIGRASCRER